MDKTQQLEIIFNDYLNKLYIGALDAFNEEYSKKENFDDALNAYFEAYNANLLSDDAKADQFAIMKAAANIGVDQAYSDLGISVDGLTSIDPVDLAVLMGLNVDSFENSRDESAEQLKESYQKREQYEPSEEFPLWIDGAIGAVSGYFTGKALQVAVNSVYNSERKGVSKFVDNFSTANYKIVEVDKNGKETGFLLTTPNVIRITKRDSRVRDLHARYDNPDQPIVTTNAVFDEINRIDGFGCRCIKGLTNIKADIVSVNSMKIKNFYQATSSDIVTRNGAKAIKLVMRPIVLDTAMKGYFYPREVIEKYNADNEASSVLIDINHDNVDVGGSTDKYINGDALIFESFVQVSELVNSDVGLDILQKLTSGEAFECGVSFEGDITTHEVPQNHDEYGNAYTEIVDSLTIERISILFDKKAAGDNQGTRVINSDDEDQQMSKELEEKIAKLEKVNADLTVKVQNFETKEAEALKVKVANAVEATGLEADFFEGMTEDKIDKIVSKVKNSKTEEDTTSGDPQKTKVKNSEDTTEIDDMEVTLPSRYKNIK